MAFGGWMLTFGFPLLARLKGLRGGPLDLFGASEERRMERRLIADYEAGLDRLIAGLTAERLPLAAQIAAVPDQIRGYGHDQGSGGQDRQGGRGEVVGAVVRVSASIGRRNHPHDRARF